MTYRDLSYYEGIRTKTHREYKLRIKIMQTLSITWSQFVVSGHSKRWLLRHSMVSIAIYSSRDCGAIKHGRPSLDSGSVKKTSRRSSSLHTK